MRMINRMIDPTSGTLTVNGDDVTKVDPVKLRLGIGYVIQSAGLMPHQRVVDNVATVPVLKGESRRAARKTALGVLERVGLDPKLANRYPAQLSGGQQQRVGVARALAADPPILLMDEPFSAVDPVVREELQTDPAAAKRTAEDDRLRHARHRRGAEARRQGGGVRPRRCAAAVRQRAGAVTVQPRK
jgi:osmoprotectant transport system ATP-binding protein